MSDAPHIEGFTIERLLGRGGMATVWQARQQSLERSVAIKVLAESFARDADDIARFHAEGRAAARLKHPNIIQVYDAGTQDGHYFYVMELVAGYTVGEWLRRKGRLSESDALAVAECVAIALDYAWSSFKMVHCDIKPDNIMVDADGTVKIADLGLARVLSTQPGGADDAITGTPGYMAPEQVVGQDDIDCRADIYALGAMLYHLVTGHMLFHAAPEDRIMDLQLTERVPDARDLVPDLSASFCDLLEVMLAKNRVHRPANWHDVLHDLHLVKKHLPLPGRGLAPGLSTMRRATAHVRHAVIAPPPTMGCKASRGARRLWLIVLLLTLTTGGLLICHLARREWARHPPRATPRPTAEGAAEAQAASEQALAHARQLAAEQPQATEAVLAAYDAVGDRFPGTAAAAIAARERVAFQVASAAAALNPPSPAAADTPPPPPPEETQPEFQPPAVEPDTPDQPPEPAEPPSPPPDATSIAAACDELVGCLLTAGADAARVRLETWRDEHPELAAIEEWQQAYRFMENAARAEARVLLSFRAQVGQDVAIKLTRGRQQSGRVVAAEAAAVRLAAGAGQPDIVITLADLHIDERLRRLGSGNDPGSLLVKGTWAWQNQAWERAATLFRDVPGELGTRLRARCERQAAAK